MHVLYAGRISKEKNIDLLAEPSRSPTPRDPRLHLVLAGGGPEQQRLRQLGRAREFLGWLEGGELAAAYASADIFCFASETDTFGQVVLEAQASGLPVLAVDAGGPRELIADGVDGLLRPPARRCARRRAAGARRAPEPLRRRLGAGRAAAASQRGTWGRALERLAAATARPSPGRLARGPRCGLRAGSRSPSTTSSPQRSSAPR